MHEQAALIHACLGLRDAAGTFCDVRPALSRMTAHLTIARALRPNETETGKLARTAGLTLIGRQKEALENIAAFAPANARWATALKLRATGDWRLVANPESECPLVQYEIFRALEGSGLSIKAADFLRTINAHGAVEWNRVVMGSDYSVQEGHRFVAPSLAAEMSSLASDWEAFSGRPLREAELIGLLNRKAERCVIMPIQGSPQLEVLGWGMLAAFAQRHIGQSVTQTERLLRDKWGVPEDAKKFEAEMEKRLSSLTTYPLIKMMMRKPNIGVTAEMARPAKSLAEEHPELTTPGEALAGAEIRRLALFWFKPAIPLGTAFDVGGAQAMTG